MAGGSSQGAETQSEGTDPRALDTEGQTEAETSRSEVASNNSGDNAGLGERVLDTGPRRSERVRNRQAL